MVFDIPGMLKSLFELLQTGLVKFVKGTPEKIEDERYRAEHNFKDFMKEVRNEEKDRTSDLNKP